MFFSSLLVKTFVYSILRDIKPSWGGGGSYCACGEKSEWLENSGCVWASVSLSAGYWTKSLVLFSLLLRMYIYGVYFCTEAFGPINVEV